MNTLSDAPCSEYEAKRFTEFLHARFTGTTPKGVVMGKLPRKELISSFGVRVPTTYDVFPDPDSVDFSQLPSRFVVKPTNLCSSHGVFLLTRQGERFFDLMRRNVFFYEEIISDLRQEFEKWGETSRSILAEEFVIGEMGPEQIPLDYKFWMFGDIVGVILQYNRNMDPIQLASFGPGFHPLPEGLIAHGKTRPQGPRIVPANADQMLKTATEISLRLDTPFCGIDLYTSGTEVIFGELTPTPGPAYHGKMFRLSQEFDHQLGTYWKEGCLKRGLSIPKISSPPPVILDEQSGSS